MAGGSSDCRSLQVSSFISSPSKFLSGTPVDTFVADLLQDLKDEKISESTKVQILGLFIEFPTKLCQGFKTAEEVTTTLMDIYTRTAVSPKCINLKCHLLLSAVTIIITTDCVECVEVAHKVLETLLQVVSDVNDKKCGPVFKPVRSVACECLREVESCYPGFLSQKLAFLRLLQQQEVTPLHQSYTLLYSSALKNAVKGLVDRKVVAEGALKDLLYCNEDLVWRVTEKMGVLSPFSVEEFCLRPSSLEAKELKSILSSLLEVSYLLTPVSQSTLLQDLIQVVNMVHPLSPIIFKSQLLRLFGTMDISLFHTTLQMKGTFTDSLFTAEDENFLLKRLVGMAKHLMYTTPPRLFYIDCLLHFPENRPISSNGEESLPVLLTSNMITSLFPTVFNDSSTILSRLNLVSLMYAECEEEGEHKGIDFIFDFLMCLLKIVENNGSQEITVTFFRGVFIIVRYFAFSERYMGNLIQNLIQLYQWHHTLAPYFINLIDNIQKYLEESSWPILLSKALQKLIIELPEQMLNHHNLPWHLKVLARVAKENHIPQSATIKFLHNLLLNSSLCHLGDWRVGNAVLSVCRNILEHQKLNSVFIQLADLLQYMFLQFDDIDIQDYARFYYTLLTNLSEEKLTSILVVGSAGGHAKVRSLSSIMAENENFSTSLTVHTMERPVLRLVRIPEGHCRDTSLHHSSADLASDFNYLAAYQDQFNGPEFASLVTLKYHLMFTDQVDNQYCRLFCIVLHFELTDSNYEAVSDINVPCLFIDRKPHVVSVALKPKRPYPTVLQVSAICTTQNGLTCHSQLEPIRILFWELFLPAPVPTSWPSEVLGQLFDQLWNSPCMAEPSQLVESLFCFQLVKISLHDLIAANFQKHMVVPEPDSGAYKVLLFLPPQNHILFNIKSLEDTHCVSIMTDNWKLLPFINSYLKEITSGQ
ncbi:AP-5 complex subunit beta-1 [Latimeria chalumnae]|uniref:AP-5 complex subunit beta-1 n=1 Tax=Latimeria chalumnae TaxID=7897 RepID=H2ZWP0_LATCH|nr:PREDICTED: AP-5 complex subunit beta-1 [Latimeria chalumnae]|eukprot:XP_006013744.1 PREDICTED: AP-5 complex subunit beta-1 [Latimeria chalumnae]